MHENDECIDFDKQFTVYDLIDVQGRLSESYERLKEDRHQQLYNSYEHLISLYLNHELFKDKHELVSKSLNHLNETTPGETNFKEFDENLKKFQNEKHDESTTHLLREFPNIREVLEIPQLLEMCVKTENYDHALTIFTLLGDLSAKTTYPMSIPNIFRIILSQVKEQLMTMISRLKSKLADPNLSLVECLRVVQFLRRLQIFESVDEKKLKVLFLSQRQSCIDSKLEKTNSKLDSLIKDDGSSSTAQKEKVDEIYFEICDIIEFMRSKVFQTLTLFTSTFETGDSNVESHHRKVDFSLNDWLLYNAFEKLTSTCRPYLTAVVTSGVTASHVANLHHSCLDFSRSLSKFGLNLEIKFTQFFREVCVERLKKSLKISCLNKFEDELSQFDFDMLISASKSVISAEKTNIDFEFKYPITEWCNDITSTLHSEVYESQLLLNERDLKTLVLGEVSSCLTLAVKSLVDRVETLKASVDAKNLLPTKSSSRSGKQQNSKMNATKNEIQVVYESVMQSLKTDGVSYLRQYLCYIYDGVYHREDENGEHSSMIQLDVIC